MHSIDTYYDRNYFRSRLEARWAVFFNKAGIKYQYEPQGFKSDSGEMYLPDFYLPETYLRKSKGVYVEIKPDIYVGDTIPASYWFEDNLVLFKDTPDLYLFYDAVGDSQGGFENATREGYKMCGCDPLGSGDCPGDIPGHKYISHSSWDNYMRFWLCDKCSSNKIDFNSSGKGHCPTEGCNGAYNNEKLYKAALAANMARFEHKNKH